METHGVTFSGALLQRGFWLYVWRVTEGPQTALYVGRTGDSSSRYAASPFSRLGQHLDLRDSAAANMLLRNIKKAGFDPVQCTYSLVAIGPIYPEQDNIDLHRQKRDLIAPLEAAVAAQLRADGHNVLGAHPKPKAVSGDIYERVIAAFRSALKSGSPVSKQLHQHAPAPAWGDSESSSEQVDE